jgi:hypothetical protein
MSQHQSGPRTYIFFVMGGTFGFMATLMVVLGATMMRQRPSLFLAMGAAFGLLAVVLGAVGIWVRRSANAALPKDQSPAQWATWAIGQRSGFWKGEYEGRTLVAQRAYRKYGVGHILVFMSARTQSRATLIRRSGAKATVGRAIDNIAGASTVSAHEIGHTDMEFSALEPDWAEAFLGAPDVIAGVRSVVADNAGADVVTFSVRPGYVSLTIGFPDLATVPQPTVETWLSALATLATTAEGAPAPAKAIAPNWGERIVLDPARMRKIAFGVVFGIVGVALVFALVLVAVLNILRT